MRKDSRFRIQGSILWLLTLGLWTLNLTLPSPSLADCRNSRLGTCSGRNVCVSDRTLCCNDPDECPIPATTSTSTGSTTAGNTSALCGTSLLGVQTAIGCLMAGDPKQLVSQLLGWGVGVGGGIAFLMIVLAGFQMATASGDPKRVQAARELLMSALAGLLLIVFSLVLLNFLGFGILKLPGFANNPSLIFINP